MFKPANELVSKAKTEIEEISPLEAESLIARGDFLVWDVREPAEHQLGWIANAINIPRGMLEFIVSSRPELQNVEKGIIVYCKVGGRAALAAQTLKAMGFNKVYSIEGGFDSWIASGRTAKK